MTTTHIFLKPSCRLFECRSQSRCVKLALPQHKRRSLMFRRRAEENPSELKETITENETKPPSLEKDEETSQTGPVALILNFITWGFIFVSHFRSSCKGIISRFFLLGRSFLRYLDSFFQTCNLWICPIPQCCKTFHWQRGFLHKVFVYGFKF